uniref:Copia proteinlike [Anolis carolinensis] n=1 Tax=Lepeophtheirus salmonis TaxID=72036 RepID=A0A0K2T901_LEPSM
MVASKMKKPVVQDIIEANKMVRKVTTRNTRITLPKLEDLKTCKIICYTDVSLANVENSGSQMGIFVMMEDKNAKVCPIAWVYKRIKRVVMSTLAAETLALLEGA